MCIRSQVVDAAAEVLMSNEGSKAKLMLGSGLSLLYMTLFLTALVGGKRLSVLLHLNGVLL